MEVKDEHTWVKTCGSLSGQWLCSKCNKTGHGGPHDGGPYFPGRGESPEFFRCKPLVRMVTLSNDMKAVRVREEQP